MSIKARTGLVVVEVEDSTAGLRVIDYACEEAVSVGADLVLVQPYGAHAPFSPMMPMYSPRAPMDLADEALRVAVAHVRHQVGPSLAVTAVSGEGSRLSVLSKLARTARLLVVGRSRAKGPYKLVTAQADVRLANHANCPVVVVPDSWQPTLADRSIAIGVDGTALSWEAVGYAFRTAAAHEATLLVMHSEPAPRRWTAADTLTEQDRLEQAELTIAETLAGWAEQYPQVTVSRQATIQAVVATLVNETKNAGLLVLGAHGPSAPGADHITCRTVAAAKCPVAIVPHEPTTADREPETNDFVAHTS
jgi:nucleotide-binding universal stress UspA family protein